MAKPNLKVDGDATSAADGESRNHPVHPRFSARPHPLGTPLASPDWASDLQFEWPDSLDAAATAPSQLRWFSYFVRACSASKPR